MGYKVAKNLRAKEKGKRKESRPSFANFWALEGPLGAWLSVQLIKVSGPNFVGRKPLGSGREMLCNCAEEATRNNNGSLSSHAAETTKQTQDFHPKPPTNMSYIRSRQRPHRICHFISVQYFSISLQFSFLRRAGNLSCLATHFWVDYVFDSGGPLQILVCKDKPKDKDKYQEKERY